MRLSDPRLQEEIFDRLSRYFELGDRSEEIVVQAGERVQPGFKPSWIPQMLERPEPHDVDLYIFRVFCEPKSVILDIGANWGYSAGSLWKVGCKSKIISFEAVSVHEQGLECIAQRYPGHYAYWMGALSDTPGTLKFVIPVVNGTMISGLATACKEPNLDVLAKNIRDNLRLWLRQEDISLRLLETESRAELLDNILAADDSLTDSMPIVGIKIDVEGLEYKVLRGAVATLRSHRPLVMVEIGYQRSELLQFMNENGYLYAERLGMELVSVEGLGTACNGFFVHQTAVKTYQESGILTFPSQNVSGARL